MFPKTYVRLLPPQPTPHLLTVPLLMPATPPAAAPIAATRGIKDMSPYLTMLASLRPSCAFPKQIGVSTTVKSRGSLREHLVHPKDKIEKLDLNGVIYYHACAGINGTGITNPPSCSMLPMRIIIFAKKI